MRRFATAGVLAVEGKEGVNLLIHGAAFGEAVESAGHDQGLEGFFVEVAVLDTGKEISQRGEWSVGFAFGDDASGNTSTKVLDGGESKPDATVGVLRLGCAGLGTRGFW